MEVARPRLTLLKGFSLTCAGRRVELPESAQRVLAFIALHDGSLRRFVAGSLWMDSSEERAQASLRSALWRLRGCGLSLVDTPGQRLQLAADVVFDVRELERVARLALGDCGGALRLRAMTTGSSPSASAAAVGFAPLKPAEFVQISPQQMAGQAGDA